MEDAPKAPWMHGSMKEAWKHIDGIFPELQHGCPTEQGSDFLSYHLMTGRVGESACYLRWGSDAGSLGAKRREGEASWPRLWQCNQLCVQMGPWIMSHGALDQQHA